jgi:hypothetical protein
MDDFFFVTIQRQNRRIKITAADLRGQIASGGAAHAD